MNKSQVINDPNSNDNNNDKDNYKDNLGSLWGTTSIKVPLDDWRSIYLL